MKLNNAMRKEIKNRILSRICIPRDRALLHREHALALRMLKTRFGSDVFDRCRAIPSGWLPLQKTLSLEAAFIHSLPKWSGNTFWMQGRPRVHADCYIHLSDYTALPDCAKDGWNAETIRGSLLNELHEWYKDHYDLAEELHLLSTQITATLASYTTVERLANGWPEGYAELPQEMLAITGGLPAPRIKDLNDRIEAAQKAA